mmetsp:Transcript_17431/g.17169  ORF Transcript_17431/g.17169 Transcript_17431/m.17169 type:complete len:288 (-) Transcript_17431:32-895(-)|eukprot:CAMPEP_0197009904 /NCGR_PEP_ID=MMETSP1380-20130617/51993_1 /TAXON_ID=5936 /ORGANISM="Euplotes crassus, Strain CT5" /LENGTH=287 /DNA_ID=CAMNT_0042431465 /DNA_START=230 /DNA_END=1093 /DNA_ORIENTATION=-
MKSYQEKQDIAHLPHRPRVTALSDGGYFSRFEWQPESYDDYLDKEKGERESHKEIIEKLHKDKKFVAGSAYAPLKYEDQFQISDKKVSKSEIVPKDPFFSDNDPYEATIEEVLKNKWMEEAKRLHGEFHAGSKESINKKAKRNLLGNMVAKIKKTILEDWQEINFVIGTNPEEFIEIKFDGQTVDTTKGLHAYMNTLLHNDEEIMNYNLRRIIHYWGYKEGQFIYYMLAPVWVKTKVNDIMNFYKKGELRGDSSFDSFSVSEEKFDKKLANRAQEKKPTLYSREIAP